MTAWDHLPAHLLPAYSDPDTLYQQRPARVLTFGTPPSPETRVTPPPIVTIRQAGERGAELYVCTSAGARFVVPLSWGHLSNLAADAVAAMIRMSEKE